MNPHLIKVVNVDRVVWPQLFRLILAGGKGRRTAQREASKILAIFDKEPTRQRLHIPIGHKVVIHVRKGR